ncbi:hypothetical protein N665_0002s0112 [Sinapis alba]|nr:hypothetical protein N665_0002s0112 [Sinapis alba]
MGPNMWLADKIEFSRRMEENQINVLDIGVDAAIAIVEAIAERENRCLEDAAAKDIGTLKVLTYHQWFCETFGFVRKTKEHIE